HTSTLTSPTPRSSDLIASPEKAAQVLRLPGADAVMIGRAAQGRPWIFRQVAHYLETGERLEDPDDETLRAALRAHLLDHYAFHGEARGVRSARKHVGWYLRARDGARAFPAGFHTLQTTRGLPD